MTKTYKGYVSVPLQEDDFQAPETVATLIGISWKTTEEIHTALKFEGTPPRLGRYNALVEDCYPPEPAYLESITLTLGQTTVDLWDALTPKAKSRLEDLMQEQMVEFWRDEVAERADRLYDECGTSGCFEENNSWIDKLVKPF